MNDFIDSLQQQWVTLADRRQVYNETGGWECVLCFRAAMIDLPYSGMGEKVLVCLKTEIQVRGYDPIVASTCQMVRDELAAAQTVAAAFESAEKTALNELDRIINLPRPELDEPPF